jgi:endonuclease G
MIKKYLLYAFVAILSLSACTDDPDDMITPVEDLATLNLAMGNPSDAETDITYEDNYLMEIQQYALSYSRQRGTANWVSWYLNEEWLGDVTRRDDFRANESLPAGWYRVDEDDYDYSNNGFARGHNCPSADRTRSINDNSNTFFMTNMIPQSPKHNGEMWNELEQYCRDLVNQGHELYIVMGSYGVGGVGDSGYREKLAGGKITVPRYIWKSILVLPTGANDLERVDEETRIITVLTENKNSASGQPWGNYRVSVDEIEAATGYDLFSKLPEEVQEEIEAIVDDGPVG